MATNYVAVAIIFCYYTIVLLLAFWSRSRQRFHSESLLASLNSTEGHHRPLFRRCLPLILGAGSMTAAWVGGGYLNGTAEAVYKNGIVQCHAPLGYAISLVIGGTFFSDRMRSLKPVTMLDPFQQRYGRWMALLLCFPAVSGEVLWTASVLAALGDAAAVLLEVEVRFFVITSAMVVFFYTSMGGFYAVTRTDGLQILATFVCLWICVPACLGSRAVGTVAPPHNDWIGSVDSGDVSPLFDRFLMAALGGIPWQVYFQRVLHSDTDFDARMVSYLSALGCIVLAIPPAVIGAAAKSANFTAVGYLGPYHLRDQDGVRVLPYSIHYLTSGPVPILGMMGITAAVLSSVDSSMLSASLLVTKNIYQALVRPMAAEDEVALVLRLMVFLIGSSATYMALSVESVFEAWSLSSELVYVLLFPQLLCLLYFKGSNTYGSLIAFIIGCGFHWLLIESPLGTLSLYHKQESQVLPFRLTCMALGVVTILLGSYVASRGFEKGWLPARYDIFYCYRYKQHSKDVHPASGVHVTGPAPHRVMGPIQGKAPINVSAQQASSHILRASSKIGADDEVPDLGMKEVGSTASKSSTVSKKSSTIDSRKAKKGNRVHTSRRRKTSSSTDSKKERKSSVGDLRSKTRRSDAPLANDVKKVSGPYMGIHNTANSLNRKQAAKDESMTMVVWTPMKVAKWEPASDSKVVERQDSLVEGSGASRRSLDPSKTEGVAAGTSSNANAADP